MADEKTKKDRFQKLKDKFRKLWEERKPDRAKRGDERKERQKKIEQWKTDEEKKANDDKKKRIKSYKCGMATAMVAGQEIAGLIPTKSARVKRDGNKEVESYMDMTACYFDEDFINSEGFKDY